MRPLCATCLLVFAVIQSSPAAVSPLATNAPPLLVVLADTGVKRDGLPVLTPSAEGRRYSGVLERGFSGRLLRLYRWVQSYRLRRDGTPIEPAYLALTGNQGGFPRYGFYLDGTAKRGVAYIDLYRNSVLSGRFGAMDQIFPHELTHVIVRQLAGEAPEGGANQMHAIGVRTDRPTAFNEGFAEAAQVLAIDDVDAAPETRLLAQDTRQVQGVESRLNQYRRALTAIWAPAPRARMTFPLWFSQNEQAMRYYAVKANRFAFELPAPDRLLHGPDVYRAYLLENVMPGDRSGVRKTPGQMLSTEGVISALFSRWVADTALQTSYRGDSFYAAFGVKRGGVPPLENAVPEALLRYGPGQAARGRGACEGVPGGVFGRGPGGRRGYAIHRFRRALAAPGRDLAGELRLPHRDHAVRSVSGPAAGTHLRPQRGIGRGLDERRRHDPRNGGGDQAGRALRRIIGPATSVGGHPRARRTLRADGKGDATIARGSSGGNRFDEPLGNPEAIWA